MKTELKDVMHLYLGCQVKFIGFKRTFIDTGALFELDVLNIYSVVNDNKNYKLILRQLSDMTKIEAMELNCIFPVTKQIEKTILYNNLWAVNRFLYALKQGFDLFHLIESGQAIDKTTLH